MTAALDVDYRALAEKAAGNWMRWESFGWWEKPDDADQWAVLYTHNRDSSLVEQSNGSAIAKALARFEDGDEPTVLSQRHNHWACGWVDGFAIRVFDAGGDVTEAFQVWCDLQQKKDDYPILDETDYSNREYDAAIESIRQEGRGLVIASPPEDWPSQVYEWLSENDDRQLENRDDQGTYPSREAIREALAELGLLASEED